MVPEMEFGLLGPLIVRRRGIDVQVRPGKQRQLLAALALDAGRPVSFDDLIAVLWATQPPASARQSLHNCVMRLRRALGEVGAARIGTWPGGYALRIEPGELDVARFEALLADARKAARDGAWEVVAARAGAALGLWRGEPLADVGSERLTSRQVPRLAELHLRAQETAAGAALRLGRAAEVVPELRRLTAEHPLREHLYQLMMLALYRDGRQAEALASYQEARRVIVDELGVEPGHELRRLHQRILAADPDLDAPGPVGAPAAPRELPGPGRHFVGRDAEMMELTALLDRAEESPPAAVLISAIGGTAGVGKTALAVHWACQVADRFPDGQLYVDLRGYDPDEPMTAADALARFLRALGVPGEDIPAETGERAARYRSLLAGRRMLVLLDNAGQVEQVRPLLPGGPDCLTLVTSRDSLAGLVAREGAVRLELGLLPAAEAVALLRVLIGPRVDAEAEAAGMLAARCARLPLALRIAAELVTARPAASLAELVRELADQQRRLDLLDAGGDPRTGVRAVFSWSYRHLDDSAARLFRRLGLYLGADFDQYAAAALAGSTVESTRRTLSDLARAHLVHAVGPDRYALHDLLRASARELAGTRDGEDERRNAVTRLLDHYLYAAATAMDTLFPAESSRRPRVPEPATPVPPLSGVAEARAWLDAELANLVACAVAAADRGWPGHATRLSATLSRYLGGSGHFVEAAVIYGRAEHAARAIGDPAAEANALSGLSQIDVHHGHAERAADRLRHALELCRAAGDRIGEARVLHNLATVEAQVGRYADAGDHHRQALELHLAAGNRVGEVRTLGGLCAVEIRLGDYRWAEENLRRALRLCQEIDDPVNEAHLMCMLGELELRRNRYTAASGRLLRALELHRAADDREGEVWALTHLGTVELRLGHVLAATDYHELACGIARESRDRFGEAGALNGLGEAYLAAGRVEEARVAHLRALHLATQTGDRYERACAHAGLALDEEAAGEPARALDQWRSALSLHDDLGTPEAARIRGRLAAGTMPTASR